MLDLVDRAEDPGVDRFAGERLERRGADERQRGGSGDDPDARAALTQQSQQFDGLVGRDAASDAEQHPGADHAGARHCLAA